MKFFTVIALCFLAYGTVFAQIKGAISGKIVGQNGQGVGFSIVSLINQADTSNVKNQQADANGSFIITVALAGKYQVTQQQTTLKIVLTK